MSMIPDMIFSSTIIPTIGRPELSRAVESVLNQDFDKDLLEVIVVNDSTAPLPEADWRKSEQVTVIQTWGRERSVARNTGASIARGRYLHFLDDDDWLAPDAMQHFWELSQTVEAGWLYGITQLVDRENHPLIRLQHGLGGNCFTQVMAGEWMPLQASLIEAATFFKLGGFNPLIAGPEDIDLLRRVACTADLAETSNLVAYVVRGESGSTTDYQKHPELSRWAREGILEMPGAFRRMRLSAPDATLHGRIVRVYLTSLIWNIRQRRVFTAIERGIVGIAGFFIAGSDIFSADFWNAIRSNYESPTFKKGFGKAQKGTEVV